MKCILLITPCAAAVAVPVYNRVDPQLYGIPFFFWAQLALVPISALFIFFAYRRQQR